MQNFLEAVEAGYSKYQNPYHNLVHAADVLQTMYNILNSAGLLVKIFYGFYDRISLCMSDLNFVNFKTKIELAYKH